MGWKDLFPKENRYFETENGILYCGDCLEIMKKFPENSVDLVVIDPPYNINKAKWDKYKSLEEYIQFMKIVFKIIERILKFTGSFYFFHSEFPLIARLHLWIEENTDFIFQNLLIWNKRFKNSRHKGYLDGFVIMNGLRKYQQMAEYILFYTFESDVNLGTNNFSVLRQYFKELQEYIGLSKKDIV